MLGFSAIEVFLIALLVIYKVACIVCMPIGAFPVLARPILYWVGVGEFKSSYQNSDTIYYLLHPYYGNSNEVP